VNKWLILNLSNLDLIPKLYDYTILFFTVKINEPKVHINVFREFESLNLINYDMCERDDT